MGNAVRKKLHSQAGASLLIALLFFLVALMVGAVVLTAAATNAGRLARNRQEQQDYLAVASAARLVEEDFRGMTFAVGYEEVTYRRTVTRVDAAGNPYTETEIDGPHYSKRDPEWTHAGKLLEGTPASDLANLYYSTVPVLNVSAPGAMNYPLKITAEGLPDVSGSLEVNGTDGARYAITVKLYIETEDGGRSNAMTMLFSPTATQTHRTVTESGVNEETIRTTYTAKVTWDTPTITKGAAE